MKKIISSSLDGEYTSIDNMVHLDRYRCTKGAPWDKSKCLWAEHLDAVEDLGSIPGDSGMVRHLAITGYRCPNCSHRWYEYWKLEGMNLCRLCDKQWVDEHINPAHCISCIMSTPDGDDSFGIIMGKIRKAWTEYKKDNPRYERREVCSSTLEKTNS